MSLGLSSSSTNAEPSFTCGALKHLYLSDQIHNGEVVKREWNDAELTLIRQAAVILNVPHGAQLTPIQIRALSPQLQTLELGRLALVGVNLDLGESGYIVFFTQDTLRFANLIQRDRVVYAHGAPCDEDTQLYPFIKPAYRTNICAKLVPMVKTHFPRSYFTEEQCWGRTHDPHGQVPGVELTLLESTRTQVTLMVGRNLSDANAGSLECEAVVNRATDLVERLACEIEGK